MVETAPETRGHRVLAVGRYVERVHRVALAVVPGEIALQPVRDRMVAQVGRDEANAQAPPGCAVVEVPAARGRDGGLEPLSPGPVLLERPLAVEEAEVVEQEQAAAGEREVTGLAHDRTVVGRDRVVTAAEERELLADAGVDAREVRVCGACARERVERARGVVRCCGDGARQHLEVGLPRVTFERGVAGRTRQRVIALAERHVRALVESDEVTGFDRENLVEHGRREVLAPAFEKRHAACDEWVDLRQHRPIGRRLVLRRVGRLSCRGLPEPE